MGELTASILEVGGKAYRYFPVSQVRGHENLPYSLTVLLENVLRCANSPQEAREFSERVVEAGLSGEVGGEVEFSPSRVLFQDFTGVPVFVDFAVMREACAELGGDPSKINPQIPCDLVIDHSVIADEFGCPTAMEANMKLEFARNRERYSFLKWAQRSFKNVRIVPPGAGICHQLNIEKFAQVAMVRTADGAVVDASAAPAAQTAASAACSAADDGGLPTVYFDTLVGTDSHTPTANGIGVLGWGVGGIEAEAAALGQPITTLVPKVIGVRLVGKLPEGSAAMDVALSFAQTLRAKGVVGCFVECFGPGLRTLSATQRACISNMTPEYGSTCTLFPVDEQTLDYLRVTGRSAEQIELVRAYAQAQGTWCDPEAPERRYSDVVEIDLSQVAPSVSGPSRPHDRIDRVDVREHFVAACAERGADSNGSVSIELNGETYELANGAIAIAAVTSCTTATDPRMMLACGLLARNAAAAGLKPKPWVKTVYAPGSHAMQLLMGRAGLTDGLQALGFSTCGFGCMSCIGNSGPVLPAMHEISDDIELASVLSGNRNFEGRISPDVSQNYLMAPASVVAYALAGTVDIDLDAQPLGESPDGKPVYLRDIWPADSEIEDLMAKFVDDTLYTEGSQGMFDGDAAWRALDSGEGDIFQWDDASTYVRRAPYFDGMQRDAGEPAPVAGARVLAKLGDFITTDHISPAGAIAPDSPAADYLRERAVQPADFNTYGARRGNHEVMMRGTFANVKLRNLLVEDKKGGWSFDFIAGKETTLFSAAESYKNADVPGIVLAGKMYGSGSSRDWAAKGPMLLGVRAVIAESFERIHRSNLIGMGVLPLQFMDGQNADTLGLTGEEIFDIQPIDFSAGLPSPAVAQVTATRADGSSIGFEATVRIDTPTEGLYYANGGILQYVLRKLS